MFRLHRLLIVLAITGLICESTAHQNRSAVLADVVLVGSVSPASPMLEPRSGHSATLLQDGKVLIAGGMRRNQDFYRSAELYDPATGRFQETGQMNVARVGAAAVLLRSGKVLIAGGWVGHGCTDSAEIYDPATGQFTVIAKLTTKRGRPNATLLANGDVLITGGADHDAPGGVASAEIFRAVDFIFEPVGTMHFARIAQTTTALRDGRVLIAGGRGDAVTASTELYDPATRKFTLTGSMLNARYKHTAGLLPDGRVLIAGGSDDHDWQGKLNSAEIYDPRTQEFSPTSPLNDSRFKLPEEAVQLASGQLLIAGGSKKVEVYDPASGTFLIAAGQMNDARHFMTATKLKDGSVLLAGGYPNNDQGTTETWIYHPNK
ncbi:MAG: Kelch repeat-containing protein [Candidatus Acidiferrales bacterium]